MMSENLAMRSAWTARMMLCCLIATGVALILVGSQVHNITKLSLSAWFSEPEANGFLIRTTTEKFAYKMAGSLTTGLYLLGGFITLLSAIGLWALPLAEKEKPCPSPSKTTP
jgi:hypothetical protein